MAKTKICIVFHTLYHHTYKLAQAIREGAAKNSNVIVEVFQVPETLPENVLAMMHAPPKPADIPYITAEKIAEADGILIGAPVRFGCLCAQMKTFMDSLGGLWAKGALQGKMGGLFTCSGSQAGGRETTAFSIISQFAHFGMIYVPIGYGCPETRTMDEVYGGTPYGAASISGGDGSRQPTANELAVARFQGENFAQIVDQYTRGKSQ